MSTSPLLEAIGKQCLLAQYQAAITVSCKIKKKVYIFDRSGLYFLTPPYDVVILDGIRTILKDDKTAVLSVGAQNAVSCGDVAAYRSLIPQNYVSEDSFGVYLKS